MFSIIFYVAAFAVVLASIGVWHAEYRRDQQRLRELEKLYLTTEDARRMYEILEGQ